MIAEAAICLLSSHLSSIYLCILLLQIFNLGEKYLTVKRIIPGFGMRVASEPGDFGMTLI
jgi:hypothetical protein